MQKVLVTFPKMSSFQTFLLLIVTLCVSWKSALAANVCSAKNDEWACKSGGCIARENLCDGIPHCRDGSDETKASCKGMQCSFTSFRCDYGACILPDLVCDGVHDCVDSSDEDSEMCRERRNDLVNDEKDEEIKRKNCISGAQMECWSGQCISITDKCNGVEDCDDGSDELLSLCQTILCKQHQFQCDYGACLPMKAKCNGTKECFDGSDEYEGLCKKEIATMLTPTTRTKSNTVTESITDPKIKTKPNITTQHVNTRKIATTILDDSTDFGTIENYEKDLTTTPEVEISLIGPATTTKTNVIRNYSEKNMQTTTPKIRETTTTTIDVSKQIDTSDTNGQEVKGILDKFKAEGNKEDFENRLNSMPSDRIELITTSTNENGTMSVQKTSVHSPAAATSAENFGLDQIIKKHSGLNTKENVTKKYLENNLEIITSKIRDTIKIPQINKNQTFPFDIRNSTPSKQSKGNENKAQEVIKIQNQLATSQTTLYTLNVTTQTPNLKANLSSRLNNSIVSNLSVQSLINSRPQTDILPTSPVTPIHETLNVTEKPRNVNYPEGITKTLSNRYSDTTTNKATTKVRTQCILRSCDYPLFCKILLSSFQESGRLHDKQARQSLFEGSEVVFYCADGYVLEGVNRIACKANGWSHKIPSCNSSCDADFKLSCTPPLKCVYEEPNINKKSTKHVVTNYFTDTVVREHFKLSFECAEGYLLEGSKIRKCTAKGWSNVMPRCVNYCDVLDLGIPKLPLKCQKFDSYTGLTNDCQYSPWHRKMKEGSFFEYSCEYGYNLNGVNRSSCMNYGWNSDAPSCIPWCDLKLIRPCKSPLICKESQNWPRSFFSFTNMSDAATSDFTVDFYCEVGYKLVGAKVITCSKDGWSHSIPTCKKSDCDASILDDCTFPFICRRYDSATKRYRRIYKGSVQQLSQHETLLISCENQYNLSGKNYLTCKGGKWDGTMPKCIAPSCRADLLPKCENPMICTAYDYNSGRWQDLINNYGNSSRTFPKDHSGFNCTDGHVLNGAKTAICNNHIIDNSIIEFTNYALNTQIVFGCAQGFKLKGEEQTICSSNGWSHRQSLKLPQCISPCDPDIFKSCKPPLVCHYFEPEKTKWLRVDNSFLINYVAENSVVSFSCQYGFKLQGSRYTYCNSQGWNEPIPKCVK